MTDQDVYEIQGRKVTLPVIVRDAGSGNAMYLVPAAAAQALIPGDAFEVIEAAPGQTQLILGIIDYRDNDLGDYDEVGIIFMVKPRSGGDAQPGTFIHKLPVNQSFTCEAGCTIWGYPKSVERIQYDYTDETARCRLEMDGRHVLTLGVPRGRADAPPGDAMQAPSYTYIGGVPHATAFSTGGSTAVSPGADGVCLELGDHPIAEELLGLGLEDAAPVMSTWTEHMNGSFGRAVKLG